MSETPVMRHMQCPGCGRTASVPDWCSRPICVHAWQGCAPEVWDGDDNGKGRFIEQSPNEKFRTPGPDTWAAMVPLTNGQKTESDRRVGRRMSFERVRLIRLRLGYLRRVYGWRALYVFARRGFD